MRGAPIKNNAEIIAAMGRNDLNVMLISLLACALPLLSRVLVCKVNNEMEIEENSIVLKENTTPDAIKNASVSSVAPQNAAKTDCLISPRSFIIKVTIVTITVDLIIDLFLMIFLIVLYSSPQYMKDMLSK